MGKSFHPVEAIGAAFEGPLLFLLASLPSGQVVSPFDEISSTRFAFVPLTSVAAFFFFPSRSLPFSGSFAWLSPPKARPAPRFHRGQLDFCRCKSTQRLLEGSLQMRIWSTRFWGEEFCLFSFGLTFSCFVRDLKLRHVVTSDKNTRARNVVEFG